MKKKSCFLLYIKDKGFYKKKLKLLLNKVTKQLMLSKVVTKS